MGRCFWYNRVSPLRPKQSGQSCWLGGIARPTLKAEWFLHAMRVDLAFRNAGPVPCSLRHGCAFPIRSWRSVICFCVLGHLQGMRQVIRLWIECSLFTNGNNGSGCFVFVLNTSCGIWQSEGRAPPECTVLFCC